MFVLSKSALVILLLSLLSFSNVQAAPHPIKMSKVVRYNLNMRVGIKGSAPFSVNTVAKNGKKTSITEISEDGLTETFVEIIPKRSIVNQKTGLWMDIVVTRKVRGNVKSSDKVQVFAYEDQEAEVHFGSARKGHENLSLGILANTI